MAILDLSHANENRAALLRMVESVNAKAIARGYEGLNHETMDEVVLTLADEETGFDYLDDQESRLGLDVAGERAALVNLFLANGLIDG